jgi:hypothetical protein
MRENTDAITLSMKPALWRIRLVDEIRNPKMVRNLNVSGPASVRGAIDTALHTDGFEEFQKQYPNCAIGSVEFSGQIDNT